MLPLFLCDIVDDSQTDKVEYLYNEHYASMMNTAMRFANCTADAEDIVHDAFLKIIKYIDKIDTTSFYKTRSLCIMVTKHVAIDGYRKDSTHIEVELEECFFIHNDDPLPLDYLLQNEGYNRLVKIIKNLKEPYKEICILKFLNNFTDSEIADLLDMKIRTVNTRIYRGRKILIEELEKEGYDA